MDLVAEVPTRDGSPPLVIVHTEVERDFGVAMDRRLFRYFAHLKIKYDRPVIPIVLFLRGGPAGVGARTYRDAFGDFVVNEFTYCAIGLSRAALDDFVATSPLGPALAACTRGDDLPRYERKYRCMEAILDAEVDDAQRLLLLNAVETYLELDKKQHLQYTRRVEQSSKREEVQDMETTWADRLRETGRLEGLETGRLEGTEAGRQEGVAVARRLLLELMTSRFGPLPAAVEQRFAALDDLAEISAWSDRVLRAGSLTELGLGL